MRFRLLLSLQDKRYRTIPVNYQYPLSAWIYKTINEGNHEFARFLHTKGYGSGNKAFKFFTFSMLEFSQSGYSLQDNRLHIQAETCALEVSFMAPEAMQHFISGLFRNQQFTLGDKTSRAAFGVRSVEAIALPVFTDKMCFTALSPILVSHQQTNRATAAYLAPDNPMFGKLLTDNLTAKYAAAVQSGLLQWEKDAGGEQSVQFELIGKYKMKGLTIKEGTPYQTKIIGYMFSFRIAAPEALIRLGYQAGFGEKNSLGLGYCQPIDEQEITN